jgi:hypothetical protein
MKIIATIILSSFFAVPALADDAPRKIDFTKVIIGPEGPFKECKRHDDASPKCLEETDLTLGRMCIAAAAMPDKGVSAVDQISHGRMAMKLLDAKQMELGPDDITFLKGAIAKLGYNTMAVYQASKLLDPTVDK